jgi:hypothetical protein
MIKKFIFSCDIFGGFEVMFEFDPLSPPTFDEFVRSCIDKLDKFLNQNHLIQLSNILMSKKYHIHDKTIEDIINTDWPIYICNCFK